MNASFVRITMILELSAKAVLHMYNGEIEKCWNEIGGSIKRGNIYKPNWRRTWKFFHIYDDWHGWKSVNADNIYRS
jgi:hypothetical protein